MKQICPCCGKLGYEEWEGEYDIPDESGAKQLSPDIGFCEICGFQYSEHIRYPIDYQIRQYKKRLENKPIYRDGKDIQREIEEA